MTRLWSTFKAPFLKMASVLRWPPKHMHYWCIHRPCPLHSLHSVQFIKQQQLHSSHKRQRGERKHGQVFRAQRPNVCLWIWMKQEQLQFETAKTLHKFTFLRKFSDFGSAKEWTKIIQSKNYLNWLGIDLSTDIAICSLLYSIIKYLPLVSVSSLCLLLCTHTHTRAHAHAHTHLQTASELNVNSWRKLSEAKGRGWEPCKWSIGLTQ